MSSYTHAASERGNTMSGKILAIDPSLTGTAVIRGEADCYELKTFASTNNGDSVAARIARYRRMLGDIAAWLTITRYAAIYLEGYSLMSNRPGDKFITEYGGLLREYLTGRSDSVYEVPPSCLKKFCTGKGNAPKDMVAAHIARRWNVMFESNDAFDAYGLYRLGLVAQGWVEADNTAQREAVATVLGGKPEKKRKRAKAEA